jgi:hypothetical protein
MALHPQPSSIPSLESWTPGSLVRAVSQEKFYKNLLLKLLYKLKKSYGGTPEPQTPRDAPSQHGPSRS